MVTKTSISVTVNLSSFSPGRLPTCTEPFFFSDSYLQCTLSTMCAWRGRSAYFLYTKQDMVLKPSMQWAPPAGQTGPQHFLLAHEHQKWKIYILYFWLHLVLIKTLLLFSVNEVLISNNIQCTSASSLLLTSMTSIFVCGQPRVNEVRILTLHDAFVMLPMSPWWLFPH